MKYLSSVAPHWYPRLNEVMLVAAILVMLLFLGSNLILNQFTGGAALEVNLSAAIFSALGLGYSIWGFKRLSVDSPMLAGFVSYVCLMLIAGSLLIGTGGLSSQYLILWVIVITLSGMFGRTVLGGVWLLTHVYFLIDSIGHDLKPQILVAYLTAVELSFLVSWFMWDGQNDQEPQTLPEGVDAQDISQGMLISSIGEGVVVVDDQYQIQVFNPAAAQITGWKSIDAKGIDYRTVLAMVDAEGQALVGAADPINQVFTQLKAVHSSSGRLKDRSGKQIEISMVASPVLRQNGRAAAVVVVFRDISEERQTERQRAEFISTASHEMRTPVAAIEGYLALAMNESVSKIDSKAREYLEKAHASTSHLGKLFQDLLTAAKSEDGRLINHPKVIEIGQMLDELAEGMRFTAEKKGLLMDYNTLGEAGATISGAPGVRPLYYVLADPERLREVVTNLFDNAVKYTVEGKVGINLKSDAEQVVIGISDTGPGIPESDIPHLFQKFYRVDNTATRQIGGTGLGLFISRKIVELNKGRIWVESQLGRGSTFYVSLPRLSTDRAEQLQRQEAAAASPLSGVTGNIEL